MVRQHLSSADKALYQLRQADKQLDVMAGLISRIVFQPFLRRALMTTKDDAKQNIAEAMEKVRTVKTQVSTLLARIHELEGQAGPWTDADMQEIVDGIQGIEDALDPDPAPTP